MSHVVCLCLSARLFKLSCEARLNNFNRCHREDRCLRSYYIDHPAPNDSASLVHCRKMQGRVLLFVSSPSLPRHPKMIRFRQSSEPPLAASCIPPSRDAQKVNGEHLALGEILCPVLCAPDPFALPSATDSVHPGQNLQDSDILSCARSRSARKTSETKARNIEHELRASWRRRHPAVSGSEDGWHMTG